MPRRTRPTKEDIVRLVINKMFDIAGHDVCYEDIVDRKDDWYRDWEMTEQQAKDWMKWMVEFFKTECKYPTKIAEREAAMINLMWGLKYRN